MSANILQALAFIGTSFCLSILFLRIFPENFYLALAANILSDIGVVVLTTFDGVGSDYIHLFLVIASILLTGFYIETKSAGILPAMFVAGMLAMLQRYIGLAAIATSIAAIFFFDRRSVYQRLSRSAMMALSILPAGLWLFATSKLIQQRAPISFSDNFQWFSMSVLQWFFPVDFETASSLAVYFTSMGIRWGDDLFVVSSSRGNIIIFRPTRFPSLFTDCFMCLSCLARLRLLTSIN